jgi:hypothetical protein
MTDAFNTVLIIVLTIIAYEALRRVIAVAFRSHDRRRRQTYQREHDSFDARYKAWKTANPDPDIAPEDLSSRRS